MQAAKLLSRSEGLFPVLLSIPAGSFLMGSNVGQDNEQPVHRVWVDNFLLAARQVTNADYILFLRGTKSLPSAFWNDPNFNHPEQPVVGVSWFEAVRYCEWLSAETGLRFRLPTEAELERAARGGREGALFPWGDNPPESHPDYADRWKTGPDPVGRAAPNEFGLFNMCDNVHEWCSDWYAPDYGGVAPHDGPDRMHKSNLAQGPWHSQITVAHRRYRQRRSVFDQCTVHWIGQSLPAASLPFDPPFSPPVN